MWLHETFADYLNFPQRKINQYTKGTKYERITQLRLYELVDNKPTVKYYSKNIKLAFNTLLCNHYAHI